MSEKLKLLNEDEDRGESSKRYGSVSYKHTIIDSVPKTHFTKKQCILVSVALTVVIVAFAVTLILGLPKLREKRNQYLKGEFIISNAEEHVYKTSAIVVDGEPCAQIGKNILSQNGSAVDAAIAMLFCDEIANPQSSGIGGGFLMVIYNRTNQSSEVIDARETAPMNVDLNLFKNNVTLLDEDGPSIAVPGQLRGMIEAHRRHGKLNWTSLVEPSIALARNGIVVNEYLEKILLESENEILSEESLKEIFVNNETAKLFKSGEVIVRPKLAQTLQKISVNPEVFYSGDVAQNLIQDIGAMNGIMTLEDLKGYTVKIRDSINVSIHNGDYRLVTVPPPGSGLVMTYLLNILDAFNQSCSANTNENNINDINDRILSLHRFIEALKFSFAKRLELGDPDFTDNTALITNMTSRAFAQLTQQNILERAQPIDYYGITSQLINDEGTGHISVIAPNGDTVSVTSSINSIFGSKRISQSTGIILNNEMKDFAVEANGQLSEGSPNALRAGKRPMASMAPSIIIDKNGNTKLAIGGIGGTRIVSSVSQVLYQTLWKCHSLKESTDASRLYYDVNTNAVLYEAEFPKVYIDGLYHFGHHLEVEHMVSAVYSILETNSTLHTLVDHRKGGSSDGL